MLQAACALLGATIALASAPVLAQSPCQQQLEAAVLKITSSGPVRAVQLESKGTQFETMTTTEYVPPDRTRETVGGKLHAGNPPPVKTVIGTVWYSGNKKLYDGPPWTTRVYELDSSWSFADPRRYFAVSCSGATIQFQYEFNYSLDGSFAVRDAARRKSWAEEDAALAKTGAKRIRNQSVLTLDGQGRPTSIRIGEYKLTSAPGHIPFDHSITITYDPSIRIEVPK